MASPTPSANGTNSPDLPDDGMVDGRQLPEISIPSPASRSISDYKSLDGNWDAGNLDSPRSCSSASTSTIGSPAPSYLTKSATSRAMKPRRNQSAYLDEESGLWKCRNCGGTYDAPNPGSRQRREHKKACEETQRMKALLREQQEQEEKAKRDELALRAQGLEEASDRQAVLAGKNLDQPFQNSHGSANNITHDPGIIGALSTTPAIPEKEEVNFGAPKELIHNAEFNARDTARAGQLQETFWKDAQARGSEINVQDPSLGQNGAGPDQVEYETMVPVEDRHLPPEQYYPAEDNGPADTYGSPLKSERSEESESVNESSTPDSNKLHPNGNLDQHWVDKTSPPITEQVKYCSSAVSDSLHSEGTLYDQLMDLHDSPVTRSASFSRGVEESSRIASLNHEKEVALGASCKRALSMDHFGVEVESRTNQNGRAALRNDWVVAGNGNDHNGDSSPDRWVEALLGRDHSGLSSWNEGAETQQNYSKASRLNGGVEIKQNRTKGLVITDQAPEVGSNGAVSSRTKSYRPQAVASRSEQAGSSAAGATNSRQSQSDSPQKEVESRNRSASSEEDDDFGAMVIRNVGKSWKQIASVGAVAVVAWVGKTLADRHQQQFQGPAPKCRKGHCAMNQYYWDDE